MTGVRVDLGPRSYDIAIRHGADPAEFARFARDCLAARTEGRRCCSALVITDANLEGRAAAIAAGLTAAGLDAGQAVVPPGEASKSLAEAGRLYDHLAAARADRQTCVVAVGGGVVGDLAGFVAATYMRGLPLLMVPTSLLAQVDSSVGGKVGVNLAAGKNLVGAFHQPIGVWIDLAHLDTLPARERRCGLAEVVKHAIIRDEPLFEALEAGADRLDAGEPELMRLAVTRSCAIKAAVVVADEFERTGLRAILNFGHTVGHAIEAVAGYGGGWQHGEAVAAGMVAEARLAVRLGWLAPAVGARLARLLQRLGLPTAAPGLDADRLLAAMRLDKKNQGGAIRCALPDRLGSVRDCEAPEDLLRTVIGAMVDGSTAAQPGSEPAWTTT